ncbi:patatin [Halomonas sp. DQ26W]|uniref:patatin-like phospholipase family protein n=1 Tax=Halomonas sp. DQ26W TaxID=2282311 RepID=UPI000DF7D83F|nr:patatin-like phospholipase family protein [Halomonas sp. DQ26W]RDB43903.1 patatin [Halomonas sp. DQ26W]
MSGATTATTGKRVALTLGSGGARGYAHIGVIDVLEARGYEVVAISGCSMGAVIGGVYAAGELDAYREWVCQLDYFDVLKLVDVTWSPMGAIRASKVMSKLQGLVGDIQIEDLPIPFTTVATDLARQREVWFQSGSLLRAMRASIAIPGVITPVHIGAQTLVDGGLLNPLPIIPTVSAHADLMLAVNVTAHSPQPVTLEDLLPAEEVAAEVAAGNDSSVSGWMDVRGATRRFLDGLGGGVDDTDGEAAKAENPAKARRAWSRMDMILASFDITQAALAKYKVAGYPPDILIEVPKTVCGAFEFHRADALIRLGCHLTLQALDQYEGRFHGSSPGMIVEPPQMPAERESGGGA